MTFHSPVWLYAAAASALIVLAVSALAARSRRRALEAFASAHLLPELTRTYSKGKAALKCAMFALGAAAVCAALARPQYGYRWEETRARGVDVIFAVDTSKSMLAEDITPNRLERAKLAVIDLADMLKSDRIGIVAFSGQAFLQCPLTLDYDAFKMSLDNLDTNVIQRGGTNIAAAITEAETAFEKTSAQKIIVLISDGEELEASAIEKAREAAKNGVKIFTLGAGGTKGEAITVTDDRGRTVKLRDESGNIVTSRLNEKVLGEIASITGGFYGRLSSEAVEKIYADGIKKLPQYELSSRMKRLPIERFQIPLMLAIIILALETLVGTRRFFVPKSGAAIIALAAALAAPQQARAQAAIQPEAPAQEHSAKLNPSPAQNIGAQQAPAKLSGKPAKAENAPKTTKKKPAKEEPPTARSLFNGGIDAYKSGDYAGAIESFKAAMKLAPEDFPLHAKSIYNIANAEYADAINPLAKAATPAEIAAKLGGARQQAAAAMQQGGQLLSRGKPLLERETEMLKAAKNDKEKADLLKKSPLKDKQFQSQLQQAISQCEALQKLPDAAKGEIAASKTAWQTAKKSVDEAANLYGDALKLDEKFADAKYNETAARKTSKNLENNIAAFGALSADNENFKREAANLETLKNELKKLLRNDDNQQNQNNQNQQNQNSQQNQNKDNKQDQQQNQNQQNQNSQQQKNENKQDQKQNQQNKSDKQNNQDKKDQQQNKDAKQGSQDKNQNQQNQNQQNQNKDGSQDKQDQKQDQKGKQDKAGEDKSKDEQAVENKPGQKEKQQEQKSGERGQEKSGEQKNASGAAAGQKQEAKAEAKPAAPASEAKEKGDDYRKAAGVMTKAEAKQLLESMKEGEKILPLRGFGEQKQRFEKSYKDW